VHVQLPHPLGSQRSYWLREALEAESASGSVVDAPALDESIDADVAIIGGGYTGLWTAWHLIERAPGIRIALLEQDICGGGPSGRNGGFLHGWWDQVPTLRDLFGADGAVSLARASDESVQAIGQWCDAHGVDAWYRRAGYLRVSAAPGQDGDWISEVEACRELGVQEVFEELTADEVQRRCASTAFRAGVLMPNAATVQPARLARGLRRALIERGVLVFEQTKVRGLARTGSALEVRTAGGTVLCDQAVLAVNAWAAGWPVLRRRILAWGSYIALTEPVPELLQEMGWTGGEGLTDSRFTIHYFRTTPDGRLAFGAGVGAAGYGGRIGRVFTQDQRAVDRAVAGLRHLLPALATARIDDAWGGPIDISPNRLPLIGSLHGGRVHYAHGYSGNGVGPSHLAGRILAALVDGANDDLARLPIVGASSLPFPPEPLRYVGARLIRESLVRYDDAVQAGKFPALAYRVLTGLPRRLGYRIGPDI
jgi:glycine/D-amino acid oxidase-like deaminating enzyme